MQKESSSTNRRSLRIGKLIEFIIAGHALPVQERTNLRLDLGPMAILTEQFAADGVSEPQPYLGTVAFHAEANFFVSVCRFPCFAQR